MIRLAPLTGTAVLSAPLTEFLTTEFLCLSMAIADLGGRLPCPAGGNSADLDAARCAALRDFLQGVEQAALYERLDRRLPGEGIPPLRARIERLSSALQAGAAGDGIRIETD